MTKLIKFKGKIFLPLILDKRAIMYYLCIVFFMVLDLRLEDSCRETIIPFFYVSIPNS